MALGAVLLTTQIPPHAQGQPVQILLVVNGSAPNPFGRYLGEILRAEGINTFETVELSGLASGTLNAARLVVLAETPLTGGQAALLSAYVAGGGRLVAMRPDAQLEPTLGVTTLGSSSADRYLSISASTMLGRGFPVTTLPMNGPSQHFSLSPGAVAQATLYTDRTTSTPYPAVVQYGRTATWAYDLARSVVYTRQGDPANAGLKRDGVPPTQLIRTTDVFYNAIDLDRVNLPYADIHMRLFSRVITDLLDDALPLPRLWYFPGAARTLLVPTADTHVYSDPATQQEIASVAARGGRLSMYVSHYVPYPDAAEASAWRAQGHEFGLHPYGYSDSVSLDTGFQTNVKWFTDRSMAPSRTVRIHGLEWPTWVGSAQLEATYNIGLDTTFYTWGPAVTYPDGHQAHGFINGSGLPMRFVDQAGTIIPVYQQVTSIIDEQLIVSSHSEQLSPGAALAVSRQLIDNSQAGGYSALVTQFHTDYFVWGEVLPWAEGTMDYAKGLGIPIWTAERWLQYVEARAATQVTDLVWSAPSVSFAVTVPAGAEPQTLMLPAVYAGIGLTTLAVDGTTLAPVRQTIMGRDILFFSVGPGTHSVAAAYGTAVPGRALDVNGDSWGDAFFYEPTMGGWTTALSTGTGPFSFVTGSWDPGWTVTPAHLNTDALTDFFLYSPTTGQWRQALSTGSGTFTYTTGTFSPGWQVAAGHLRTGPLDDVFVYNPTRGGAYHCVVDGAGGFSGFFYQGWSPGWDLHLADLDGDQIEDVFVYNPTTGHWFSCLNDGPGLFRYQVGDWSPGWTLTVGDFDGNARDDLFVYNPTSGRWFACLSAGDGTFTYTGGSWSPGWQVVRARLDADAADDLFVYNPTTGNWFQCVSDGTGGFRRYVGGTWSRDWHLAVTDLDGDALDDLVVYNPATGEYFQCLTAPAGDFRAYLRGTTAPGATVIGARQEG